MGQSNHTYDAIVIGSGISGGWAAKELCEKGLKTLIIERGRSVEHVKDYPTAFTPPWEFEHRGRLNKEIREANPVASRCYAFTEAASHFFLKDNEQPYVQEKPFDWIRGNQVGGKSLLWARQVQRWSRYDFEGPARDGFAVAWPFTYDELAPWYSHVERFIGVSGNKDGLDVLPDGEFLPPWQFNECESAIRSGILSRYKDRHVVIGRCAHLTKPQQIHIDQGRGQCQARSLCERGCPYGGYFSSNASTLPWAAKTGNLTIQPDSVVHSIIYDDKLQKASGVRVINVHTKQMQEYHARIIFVNASTIASNQVLLNSVSSRFPAGLGNDNGLLGKYVAFHNYRGSLTATMDGMTDSYYHGRRPCAVMMPNFRNVYKQDASFQRGYMTFYLATRSGWARQLPDDIGIGADLKNSLTEPGSWSIYMMMQGETIPKATNTVKLDPQQKDPNGIPQLVISVDYDENDKLVLKDFSEQAQGMLEAAGAKNIRFRDSRQAPGLDIHEMGGVRMGKDPRTSLLNKFNQLHTCKNVFVTDGACMTSTGTQNPSLTFMAITARAVDHAVDELKKMNL
ncbi:MAG: GMC oxidoreductase [Agriterribacter sp.]